MKRNILNHKVVNIVLWGVLILLISLIPLKFPVLFLLSSILATIPIAIITIKYKETVSITVSLIILIILLLSFEPIIAIIKIISYTIPGICIGYSLRTKFSLQKSIVVGGVAYIIVFAISNIITNKFLGINIIQDLYINNLSDFLHSVKAKSNKWDKFVKTGDLVFLQNTLFI